MSESAGKKLAEARLKRGLSIEEAAHATKLRPEKIVALENDDYASFPSNAYAKGFLKNYARYLRVDVSTFVSALDSTLPISISDYQYLSNSPAKPAHSEVTIRRRRPPSLKPLLIGAAVIFLTLIGFWAVASYQRIFGESPRRRTSAAAPANPVPEPALPSVAPELTQPATLALEPSVAEPIIKDSLPPAATPVGTDDHAVIKPGLTGNPDDHDFVKPVPVATAEPDATAAPVGVVNEILVASLKKTWVAVRKDDPKSPPVFEDYLYPSDKPLKLRGTRFFIEAREPADVQITKNGLPIAYQPAGVPIQ